MKLLQERFIKNYDNVGDTTFTQLKKQTVNNQNIYIYSRKKEDGSFNKFEVFIAKQRFKGQPLPGGNFEKEDREQYPSANSFGFTAKELGSMKQAEISFNEFVEKAQNKQDAEDETAAPKRPLLAYPLNKWSMKDLLLNNPQWSQALAYVQVQKDIKNGLVKEIERVKSATGRGKLSVIYQKIP